MACFSPDTEAAIINALLRGTTLTATSNVYVGLFTALPTGGIGGTEVAGGSYARVEIASTTGNWATPSNGETSNLVQIRFPIPSASWGEVVGVGVWSAASGGAMIMHGTLTPSRTITNGQPAPVFIPGAFILRVDSL